jgi:hypothetical protein
VHEVSAHRGEGENAPLRVADGQACERPDPTAILPGEQGTGRGPGVEDDELDRSVGGVVDEAADSTKLIGANPCREFLWGRGTAGFKGRGLPHPGPEARFGAAFEENAAARITNQNAGVDDDGAAGATFWTRDSLLNASAASLAERPERTLAATGRGGDADCCAQFHEALIEGTGAAGADRELDELLGALPGPLDARVGIKIASIHAEEHARDVPVHERRGAAEDHRGDGAGGIAANPWELKEVIDFGWDLAAQVVGDGLGRGVEMAGAAVIAQT